MAVANIVCVIATAIQAASMNRATMIASRVLLGIGSVMLGPSAQSYVTEISYPAFRGVIVSLYNGCYFVGAIVSTWLSYGLVNDTKGDINWRLPMATQAIPCVTVLAVVYWIPESPRWLMSNGREREAMGILTKYVLGHSDQMMSIC